MPHASSNLSTPYSIRHAARRNCGDFVARISFVPLVVLAIGLAGLSPAALAEPDGPIVFERDIRPILEAHCLMCHGATKQESNYRLDDRQIALAGGDSGERAITAGDLQSSHLWTRVNASADDEQRMPPADEGKPLSDEQRELLRRWIEAGAEWPDASAMLTPPESDTASQHWSFQPIVRPPVPPVAASETTASIDRFILERLKREGLTWSPPADRVRLIRRVYWDVLGLPPSPELVRRFVDDPSPNAYEQLVDRVLSSPQFGERWARHWLDIIRFGESDGFETNRERPRAYPYRDYVISAFNHDLPYRQFIVEQLAGDVVGVDVATGYLVAGPYDIVKSPDPTLTLMQRQDELSDLIGTTGSVFLGLTVGCARCHNHKFDPITQNDFYGMQAIFSGVQHGERTLTGALDPKLQEQLHEAQRRIAESQAVLRDLESSASSKHATETQQRRPVSSTHNVEEFAPIRARRVRFTIRATLGQGEPCLDELEIFACTEPQNASANAQACGESAPRADSTGAGSKPVNVALAAHGAKATASGTLPGYAIHQLAHVHDGRYGNSYSWISNVANTGWIEIELKEPTWINRLEWGRDREALFRDRIPVSYRIDVELESGEWHEVANSLDREPLRDAAVDPESFLAQLPPELAKQGRAAQQTLAATQQELAALQAQIPLAYVGTFTSPTPTHRLYRGDPLAPREVVNPSAIRVLGELQVADPDSEQSRRLALAEWIADAKNPLTARVIVNRLWQHHFGTGIVATPSDFGANGVPPSHPELLDYLAHELIAHDWSLKWLHREILRSRTYRQDSRPQAAGQERDAGSRLLWRYPPRRLEAEAIRDGILSASGALNAQAGGKGFLAFEVQPENVYHYFPRTQWGPNEWRRMIYMTKIRLEQDAVFGVFDCPDAGQVMPSRSRSTTPLQALNLFNSTFVLQQAQLFAERVAHEAGPNREQQIRRAYVLLFSRDPDRDELAWSLELADKHGMEALMRGLLNANEFVFLN